ncbi:unnamed protein product, partial [Nesidiocoris tenuis]
MESLRVIYAPLVKVEVVCSSTGPAELRSRSSGESGRAQVTSIVVASASGSVGQCARPLDARSQSSATSLTLMVSTERGEFTRKSNTSKFGSGPPTATPSHWTLCFPN